MSDRLNELMNKDVVIDTDASFSYVGRLTAADDRHVELRDVVIFDERIIKVSLEEFLVECRKNGLSASRGTMLVNCNRIVAISPFEDVIIP